MNVSIEITDADVERIARRVVELLEPNRSIAGTWLDVDGAAAYLSMTEHAIRGLVKRRQLPVHRTESGRLRFDCAELDAWARGDHARPTDLRSEDTWTYDDGI